MEAAYATARMGQLEVKLLSFGAGKLLSVEAGAMYETADFMPYFESL